MNIEILKSIIIEGQELLTELHPIKRSFDFEKCARYVFVGVRQAGKSFLMYLRAMQLMEEGHELEEMLFINFDDERLLGFKAEDFDDILTAYSSLFPYKPFVFMDEIQNIQGWEHFARRLANRQYQVYITGSNAKMLSSEIASTIGGRYLEKMILPYSFGEFIRANGIEITREALYGRKRGEIERLLTIYFEWGGFPELTMFVNKRDWLNQLYEKILLGDIIRRHNIRNEQSFRLTIRRLAESVKTPVSLNRLANIVRATGSTITAASVSDYLRFCKESCLIFELENYASKFVEKVTIRKHYFIDNGLLNIFLSDSETALMENLCAITLYRESLKYGGEKVYYYNKECEIDFYLPQSQKGIQVAYSLTDESTKEREVRALISFHLRYGLSRAEIVTYSEEGEVEIEGLTIKIIPLAKWLLSFENDI